MSDHDNNGGAEHGTIGIPNVVALLSRDEFYEMLEDTMCFREGHLVFHDLHHEFYLNPAAVFEPAGKWARLIADRLAMSVIEPPDFLLVPEHSEALDFGPTLSRAFDPEPRVIKLPYRRGPGVASTATPYEVPSDVSVKAKNVLFVDSGTISGEAAMSIRDSSVRAGCRSVHIFTFFHRKDDSWALNLTSSNQLGFPVRYYYAGRLFLPVWRTRDCPWETEEEYWKSRLKKFHTQRAQIRIQQHLRTLKPVRTAEISWTRHVEPMKERTQLQLDIPGAALYPETFAKLRLFNDFYAAGSLPDVLKTAPSSVITAIAAVGVAHAALENSYLTNPLPTDVMKRVIGASNSVTMATGARPRDRWRSLSLIRMLTPERFLISLPQLIQTMLGDEGLYLPLCDNIYRLLEEKFDSADDVRIAFDVARGHLDSEFDLKRKQAWSEADANSYKEKSRRLVDLRHDQIGLLPMGTEEDIIANVLFPLRKYIAGDRPTHVPVARAIGRILAAIEQAISPQNPDAGAVPSPTILRLHHYLQSWQDDVSEPLVNVYTLLQRLLERQDPPHPPYLSESVEGMYFDIQEADARVTRLLDIFTKTLGKRGLEEAVPELRELDIHLSRLNSELFSEGSEIQLLVHSWFLDVRAELYRLIEAYTPDFEARGIRIEVDWNSHQRVGLWHSHDLHHALDNFFADALKPSGGPFPTDFDGERRISIVSEDLAHETGIRLIWQDTGVGLTRDAIESIDDAGSDRTLSTVKRRLRKVGGDLLAERGTVGGSKFTLEVLGVAM